MARPGVPSDVAAAARCARKRVPATGRPRAPVSEGTATPMSSEPQAAAAWNAAGAAAGERRLTVFLTDPGAPATLHPLTCTR